MATVADYFQAGELFEHCVEQFKGGLRVGNVVERLVCVHDSEMPVLEEAAMAFIQENALLFHVSPCFVCWLLSPHACAALQEAVSCASSYYVPGSRRELPCMPFCACFLPAICCCCASFQRL